VALIATTSITRIAMLISIWHFADLVQFLEQKRGHTPEQGFVVREKSLVSSSTALRRSFLLDFFFLFFTEKIIVQCVCRAAKKKETS
jgi:hypothetical protein